MEGKRKISIW